MLVGAAFNVDFVTKKKKERERNIIKRMNTNGG